MRNGEKALARTPHTDKPQSAVKVGVWIEPEELEFLDSEAKRRDRSRAYLINEAVGIRRKRLLAGRKSRAKEGSKDGTESDGGR